MTRATTGPVKVRVIGIDTPETVHPDKAVEPFGTEASARARQLLLGRTVRVQYDPDPTHDRWDKFGRLLTFLQLPNGRHIGRVIIADGLGRAYLKCPFTRQKQYIPGEVAARQAEANLWDTNSATESLGGYISRSSRLSARSDRR